MNKAINLSTRINKFCDSLKKYIIAPERVKEIMDAIITQLKNCGLSKHNIDDTTTKEELEKAKKTFTTHSTAENQAPATQNTQAPVSSNKKVIIGASSLFAGAGTGTAVGLAAAGKISISAVASLVTSMKLGGAVLAAIASTPIGLGVAAGVLGAALTAGLTYLACKHVSSCLARLNKSTTASNTDAGNTDGSLGTSPLQGNNAH